MKNYSRQYPFFALCGLKCGLCPIHHMENGCPGCGGGEGNQGCSLARCSRERGNIEYCFECEEFPCDKYKGIMDYDSFVPHGSMIMDLKRARSEGIEAIRQEIDEKVEILNTLLSDYNDGRKKSFYCTAVNLLSLKDVKEVMQQIEAESKSEMQTLKEKAALAAKLFNARADERGIILKLNKRPRKK